LSKPLEMNLVFPRRSARNIPTIKVSASMGENGAGISLGDLADRKVLEDSHNSITVKEDGRPRRRSSSLGEVLG
jgi:hypothetical protein